MFSSRNLTSCLAIAALLLGNAAGWMHVGCLDSAECCVTGSDGDTAANLCGHGHAAGSCHDHQTAGHHHPVDCDGYAPDCDRASVADKADVVDSRFAAFSECETGQNRAPRDRESSPSRTPCGGHEHDSDSCSVCQNLFVSRHTLPVIAAVVLADVPVCSTRLRIVDVLEVPSVPHTSLSVRGPPRV